LIVSLVVLMLLMGWLIQAGMTQVSRDMMISRLEHDAEALLASLQIDPNGKPELQRVRLGNIYNQPFSGHYYTVAIAGKTLRSRSLWDQSLRLPQVKDDHAVIETVNGPDHQVLLQWTRRFERFAGPVVIAVAEDVTALQSAMRRFSLYFALAALVMLIILLIIQGVIVRRSMASLHEVRKEVKALSDGEINMLSGNVPSEIGPLVQEVNHLLQLLSQRLQRSRNAVGNLAHSLKHPLNLLMQLADNEVVVQHPELLDEINRNTRQIRQVMERELKRARLSGGGMPGQRFAAEEEIPGLIEVLRKVYQHKKLDIQAEMAEGLEYAADRNDMLELLGNLMDNACKWANGQVRIKLWQDSGLHIQIEDDGPGCNEEQMSRLMGRGVRIDEDTSGSGLGLAIVQEIVEIYQGTIHFSRSALGGLSVTVVLPPR
jgi:signal transduction histidine kinase